MRSKRNLFVETAFIVFRLQMSLFFKDEEKEDENADDDDSDDEAGGNFFNELYTVQVP